MPTPSTNLALASVTQQSLVTLRATFTKAPLATSSSGSHDALNTANWTISGPGSGLISGISAVPTDPLSVDIFLVAPLASGLWTVTAGNAIQDTAGNAIIQPKSLQVTIAPTGMPEPVPKGSVNDDAEEIIRQFFNPALRGPNWDALIKAIAKEEQANYELAQLAAKQKHKATASGIYLTRKAGDDGVERPKNVGMSDETFRKFSIGIVNNQITEEAFLEVLEVFYGQDAVRASFTSGLAEPYALQDGDDLEILIDEEVSVRVVFGSADFGLIGSAKAIEVAAAITRAFEVNGTLAWALPVIDNLTQTTKVCVFSPSKGLGSSLRITGGKAQNALQFSTPLALVNGSLPTWDIVPNTVTGRVRFTTVGVTGLDLSGLRIGDYVNIYGGEFFAANRGSFPILDVSVSYPGGTLTQWFEIENLQGVTQSGLVQASSTSVLYYRPTRGTTHAQKNRAVAVATMPDQVDITIPATSVAVNRGAKQAAYVQANAAKTATLSRSGRTVTATCVGHGLSVGDWIEVEGATPVLGAMGGGFNGMWKVLTKPDANTFTYQSRLSGTAQATNATVTSMQAQKNTVAAGPYIFDPTGGVGITGKKAKLTQDVFAGHQYGSLAVDDATQFPDAPGYLVIAFGYENRVAPVPYLGRLSPTALILDYSFVFPQTVTAASQMSVVLLNGKGAFVPKTPEKDGAFYLTDSAAGRIAASGIIDDIAAGGLKVTKTVVYPGDRGLGNAGRPTHGSYKISDVVDLFGSSDPDADKAEARVS